MDFTKVFLSILDDGSVLIEDSIDRMVQNSLRLGAIQVHSTSIL